MLEKIKSAATKKIGPFPLWIWGLGGAAAVVIGLRIARGSGGQGAPNTSVAAPIPATVASGDSGSSVVPSSAGTFSPPPVPDLTTVNALPQSANASPQPGAIAYPAAPAASSQLPAPNLTPPAAPQPSVSDAFVGQTQRLTSGVPVTFLSPTSFSLGGTVFPISPGQRFDTTGGTITATSPAAPAGVGSTGPSGSSPTPTVQPSRPYIYTQEQAISNARAISSGQNVSVETTKPTSAMAAFLSKFGYKG